MTSAAPARVYCTTTGDDAPGASDSEPLPGMQLASVPSGPQPAVSTYAAELLPVFVTVNVSATDDDTPAGSRCSSVVPVTCGAKFASGGEYVNVAVAVTVWLATSRAVATSDCCHGLMARLL